MNNISLKDLRSEAIDWHTLEPDRVFATLHSSEAGLSADQATERLRIHGPNLIRKTKHDGILRLMWRQINNSLIWVLLASGTLAILLGKMTDGLVVLSVVLINAVIGFIQEFKAGRAIEALSEMVPQNAVAIREGKNCTISASELVPGDVVLLAAGDSVAADMRLVSIKNLQVEEAALTGESVPVEKNTVSVSKRCRARRPYLHGLQRYPGHNGYGYSHGYGHRHGHGTRPYLRHARKYR
ncbi:HAD-IC family P-type ATPase [uncultured Desulfobacter sp.]|uniref:HAD-IC family P-type ATPase n=1 Tax=uncultured Desulfobacter sp. TaxID=240139 RepID=UPI0029C7189D|nr:HAD-IC family P-type ATPase [uncultured Desulfobacter sp.]